MIKRKDNLALLGMIVLSIVFYGLVVYHVDYVWDSIQKRIGLFGKTILFLLRTDVLVFRCHHTNSPKRFGIHRAISIAKIRHGFKKLF